MTSPAFSFGVLPLAIATGASAASQTAIGTGVLGGLISATVLAILFVPVFFVVVMKLFDRPAKAPQGAAGPTAPAPREQRDRRGGCVDASPGSRLRGRRL